MIVQGFNNVNSTGTQLRTAPHKNDYFFSFVLSLSLSLHFVDVTISLRYERTGHILIALITNGMAIVFQMDCNSFFFDVAFHNLSFLTALIQVITNESNSIQFYEK